MCGTLCKESDSLLASGHIKNVLSILCLREENTRFVTDRKIGILSPMRVDLPEGVTDLVDLLNRTGGTWPLSQGLLAGKWWCSALAAVKAELCACVFLTLCRIHLQ